MLSSNHHVLKTHHLDGKQNWQADHLVNILVNEMLPHYENHCHRQEWQFDSAHLAKKCCKKICACIPEISNDSIQSLGNGCFHVQSTTDMEKMYLVNLSKDCTPVMSTMHLIDYG